MPGGVADPSQQALGAGSDRCTQPFVHNRRKVYANIFLPRACACGDQINCDPEIARKACARRSDENSEFADGCMSKHECRFGSSNRGKHCIGEACARRIFLR